MASCLQVIWDECRPLLDAAWNDFLGAETATLALARNVETASLCLIIQRSTEVSEADAFCREITTAVPPFLTDRMLVLDRLNAGQNAARAISESVQLGKACFGSAWAGLQSQWPDLKSAAEWIAANLDIRTIAARLSSRREVAARAESVELRLNAFLRDTENVFSDLRLKWG